MKTGMALNKEKTDFKLQKHNGNGQVAPLVISSKRCNGSEPNNQNCSVSDMILQGL